MATMQRPRPVTTAQREASVSTSIQSTQALDSRGESRAAAGVDDVTGDGTDASVDRPLGADEAASATLPEDVRSAADNANDASVASSGYAQDVLPVTAESAAPEQSHEGERVAGAEDAPEGVPDGTLVAQATGGGGGHDPPDVTTKPRRTGATLTAAERREASMLSELYAILRTTERLEMAFVKGAVSNEDYERHCMQILAQFKTLQVGLRDKCPDIRAFIKDHGLQCPLAEERLLGTGVAATALIGATSGAGKESLACFSASEGFITLNDALKLNMTAVDELLPLLRDLQSALVNIPNLPQLPGFDRILAWLSTVNGMRASDNLSEEQSRQLAMDVDQAYVALKSWLQEKA